MSKKLSISLPDAQSEYAHSLVEQGLYGSVSAVLQGGLTLLRKVNESEDIEIQALRQLLSERQEGTFISADAMRGKIAAMGRKQY